MSITKSSAKERRAGEPKIASACINDPADQMAKYLARRGIAVHVARVLAELVQPVERWR